MPVSETLNRSAASFGRHAVGGHFDDDIAGFGELDRVAHEIDQHLPQAAGIADEAVGNIGLDATGELEPLLVRGQGEQPYGSFHRIAQAERNRFEREPAGLDFRDVEDVVQDAKQRLGRLVRRADVLALTRGRAASGARGPSSR